MGRKAKKCTKKCGNHLFLLKPVHYSAYFSREVEVSYCPASLIGQSAAPKFNKDGRYFTSCFLLPADEKALAQNHQNYKEDHQKFKIDHAQEKSLLVQFSLYCQLEPKPRSKSNYCNVCKLQYQDYLEHIQSPLHKYKVQTNKYQPFIKEICSTFQESHRQSFKEEEDHHFSISLESSAFTCSSEKEKIGISPNMKPHSTQLFGSCRSFHYISEHAQGKEECLFSFGLNVQGDGNQNLMNTLAASPLRKDSYQTEVRTVKLERPLLIINNQTMLAEKKQIKL